MLAQRDSAIRPQVEGTATADDGACTHYGDYGDYGECGGYGKYDDYGDHGDCTHCGVYGDCGVTAITASTASTATTAITASTGQKCRTRARSEECFVPLVGTEVSYESRFRGVLYTSCGDRSVVREHL